MLQRIWFKFLRPFYATTIFRSITKLIMPFYMVYLLYIWLDLWQIALIWSFRSVVGLIFEVPTWTIADLYWKKFSVILWYILTWISLLLIPFFDWFIWITIIFCINALAETLFSGADVARVSDVIEANDKTIMNSYFSWIRSIRNFWAIIAGILWTLVVTYLGMDWLWYIFWMWMIISSLFLLFAKDGEKWYEEETEGWLEKKFRLHIRWSLSYIWKNKLILFLFLWIALFYLTDEMTWLVRVPYIQSLWFNIENMWLVYAMIGAWWIIVPLVAEKVLKFKNNPTNIIFWVCLGFATLLLFSSISTSIILLVSLFVLYNFIDDFILPIEETITNRTLDKKRRSTLLSIKSMVESLSSIIGWPLAGILLWYITLSQWLLVWAWLIVLMWVIYKIVWNFLQEKKAEIDT